MKNFKRSLFFGIGIILAMVASSCSPKKQNDCGFVQNVYGQRISWKTKKPVTVYLDSTVPAALVPAIERAAQTWNDQIGRKVIEISKDFSQLGSSPRDQKNGIYFLSDWESDKSSEQGRTSVYWAGDEIQEADIRINAADFSYYSDVNSRQELVGSARLKALGKRPVEGYNFEALMLHEMGHFLGMKHREGASVMVTHLAPNVDDRIHPYSSDQEAVTCEYK